MEAWIQKKEGRKKRVLMPSFQHCYTPSPKVTRVLVVVRRLLNLSEGQVTARGTNARAPRIQSQKSSRQDTRSETLIFGAAACAPFSASRAFPDTVVYPVRPSSRASGPLRARASAKQVKCGDENNGRSRGLEFDSRASTSMR